jgi:hypothetical protein
MSQPTEIKLTRTEDGYKCEALDLVITKARIGVPGISPGGVQTRWDVTRNDVALEALRLDDVRRFFAGLGKVQP